MRLLLLCVAVAIQDFKYAPSRTGKDCFWDKIRQGNGIRIGRTKVSWHVRESVGPDHPIMVNDCWMALNVQYTIELATACVDMNQSCILMALMASHG